MTALRRRLAGIAGWRRLAVAAGLGVLAATALPPVYALPLLVPAFTLWLWMIEDAEGPLAAAVAGWWFGFGLAVAGVYWIGVAFTVEAGRYGWMAPFAVATVAGWTAVFPALVAWASRVVFDRRALRPVGRVLVLGAFWVASEWLRGWLLTGFPWNLMGTVWLVSDAMIQVAAVTGVHGLSLLAVVVAAMLAVAGPGDGETPARVRGPVLVACAVVTAVWAFGLARLAGASAGSVEGVRLRLVQPNIPQELKWRPDLRKDHVERQIEMSLKPPAEGPPPTHVIWAETAAPFDMARTLGLADALARAAPVGGAVIVGAPRTEVADGRARTWNSLHAIDPRGRIIAQYDKVHLVPFGEYVPLRGILPVERLAAGRGDFQAGPGVRTLTVPGLPPFSPLICYEVIFPGRVADRRNRPGWLLNVTNDGWFGPTSGPYQHFAAARLRAVEEGLPLVRVANTGISGVVDAYGRVTARLGLGLAGVIDQPLPRALARPTPFARFGDWMTAVIFFIALAAGGFLKRR